MIDRTRFTLDLDSEGFPMPQAFGIAVHMIGQRYDGQVQGGLLADAKCTGCSPKLAVLAPDYASTEARIVAHMASINPKGWNEVDGVKLPHITWAEPVNTPIECDHCCPDGECIAERVLRSGRAM